MPSGVLGGLPPIRWSAVRAAAFAAALAAAALTGPALLLVRPWEGALAVAIGLVAGGLLLARFAARPLSRDLVYVCNLDGTVGLHMHPLAFGVAAGTDHAGPDRHAQAVRLLRTLRLIAERRTVEQGTAGQGLVVSVISQLCEGRLMRRLGFSAAPTPRWKVLILRALFLAMAPVTWLRGRRLIHRDGGNWAVTWTITIAATIAAPPATA